MWLPTPTDTDVRSFQSLVLQELGLELAYDHAQELATQVLLIYFYQTYGCSYLREKINGKRGQANSELGRPVIRPSRARKARKP